MALLWPMLKLVWVNLDQQGTPAQLDLGIVGCRDNWSQRLVEGPLALPYPILGSRNFPPAPYLEFPYLPILVLYPLLGFPLHLNVNWHSLLGFLRLQWDDHACMWRWDVWAGCCLICWCEKSPFLAWESSTKSAGRFPCLSSMPWTYIRLGCYHWDRGRLTPWFWEIWYWIGYPSHDPDITVPDVYGGGFLKSKLLPDMMVLGLRLSNITPFVGSKFSIFTVLRILWVVKSFGSFWKERMWRLALHPYFITLICLLMSGTCLFAATRFISAPPGRYPIRLFRGSNLPSVCTVMMRKPWCR